MNKLTAEKCREQFEEWFAEYAGQTVEWVKNKRVNDTHYKTGPEINGYWFAWQASREAIEIVMPPSVITTEIGPAISHEKMNARLAVNGIKVKS
ncbi:hypothetical protein [Pantoea sp. UYEF8]|uniref:hypothetical protein n=1 Tax=Pantoea sp. UYEF8 TaxID=1756394 RepID=UPI003399C097